MSVKPARETDGISMNILQELAQTHLASYILKHGRQADGFKRDTPMKRVQIFYLFFLV